MIRTGDRMRSARSTRRAFLLDASAAALAARAQTSADLLRSVWTARWISARGAPPGDYGVCHFRRTLELPRKPERFVVHVSADQRYQLFVNGRRAAWGPARGDLFHWRYETIDLAPFLDSGKNVFAAIVWNFGELAPQAQMTLETGFVLQGAGDAERDADTGTNWKCARNPAYQPIPVTGRDVSGY